MQIVCNPALEINSTDSIEISGSISTSANSQEPETNSYNLDHYVMTNKDIMDEIQMEHNIDDRIIIPHREGVSVLNDQIGSCNKRKIYLDEDCSKSKKKLRCQISNFGIIRREDFTCSKAWQRFVQFMAYSKSTMLKLVRKNERMQSRVDNLRDIVVILKKRALITDSAAETLEDCLYLFAQIVLGVHHIHSKSILHRDLKPDNIMLTGHMGDIVKIGDFGLSRDLRISNMSHAGSYYYIAPEMLKKESYNLKSDIWSMGVILYEMLTKELAFPASSMREIIKMISNEKPHLFQTSDVSVETQVIVYKMLQQNSTKRPSTRLLLLCPSLVPYIAKVYLNLGRGYAVPSDELSLEMFEKYIAGCKIEECQTSL